MKFRCHKCGNVSEVPDGMKSAECLFCGAVNVFEVETPDASENTQYQIDESTSLTPGNGYSEEPTQIAPPSGAVPPFQSATNYGNYGGNMMPPPPKKKNILAVLFLIVALVVVVAGGCVWYFTSQRGADKPKIENIEEYQEDMVRNFYTECVFGSPTLRDLKSSLSPRMLEKVRTSDSKYAMYKFLTGEASSSDKESRLISVTSSEDNMVRVDYIDNGVKATSLVTLKEFDGEWKISDVELINKEEAAKENKVESVEVQRPEVGKYTYSYTGDVDDDYPIRGTLTFTEKSSGGYILSGKYAYESTLRKYGDKKTSWINVNGSIDEYGNVYWKESISGNPDYDSHFNGSYTGDFRNFYGSVGSDGGHTLTLSR